ncbi:MAG: hypothetical protein M0R21_03180 [Lentimicrobiaceae bacterium]|jgi:uncharacterized protein YpuA (DUF1002 family)|nr:hypothetical protein [Lentimicrobiaceae bacterium]
MEAKKGIAVVHFTEEEKQTAEGLIKALEKFFEGKLAVLTPEERHKYGSVNEQNKLVINKVNERLQTAPDLKPDDVDWEEFAKDYASRHFLENAIDRINSLMYRMGSSKILHDYDNYQDALAYYNYTYYKMRTNNPGAAEIYNELKEFFKKAPRKTTT